MYSEGLYYTSGMVEYNKVVIKRGAWLEQKERHSAIGTLLAIVLFKGDNMFNVASYSLIERKLIINNPSQFFCELKYRTIEEVYKSLRRAMDFKDYTLLYEDVLRIALSEKSNWKDLIANTKGIETKNYLTRLDTCLRTLVKSKYIECK